MGAQLQWVIRIVIGAFAVLVLTACSDAAGVDQYGRKVPSERIEGQWLVINYWAEWCGPCRTEIPQLNALDKQLAGQGVSVLGVNFDNVQGAELKRVSEALGIRFTVLASDPAERFKLPRSEALPVTYIIDNTGRVRERLLGEQTAAGIQAKLAALKAEG
ncbi:TlpA disulfide reductase family protein [Pseudomonas sp. EL_65y_Pfl2_R95]|uniref:TlpA disulfide reductase family protein n=1 Tax=Pseudomonas sp. EL_65y_Pfl2_R95 TaxID=3088698 RepID=UPI0030D74F92